MDTGRIQSREPSSGRMPDEGSSFIGSFYRAGQRFREKEVRVSGAGAAGVLMLIDFGGGLRGWLMVDGSGPDGGVAGRDPSIRSLTLPHSG